MINYSNTNTSGRHAEVGRVRGLLSPSDVKTIPGAPSFILGMVELQGRWIPVLDLGDGTIEENRCVVVVENIIDGHSELFGIVSGTIDEASAASDLHPGTYEELPSCFPYTDVVADFNTVVEEICDTIRFQKALITRGLDERLQGNA